MPALGWVAGEVEIVEGELVGVSSSSVEAPALASHYDTPFSLVFGNFQEALIRTIRLGTGG